MPGHSIPTTVVRSGERRGERPTVPPGIPCSSESRPSGAEHTHTHESRVGPLPSARSGEKQPQTRRLGDRPNRAGAHTSSSSNGWPLKYLNCCLNYTLGISHDHQWIMMVRLQAFSKNSDKQFLSTVTGHGILCISKNQTG